MKNLYLISQTENNDWDTFDSVVVCAESEEDARGIHPEGTEDAWEGVISSSTWASSPEKVSVKFLGKADECLPLGVILASFNAG